MEFHFLKCLRLEMEPMICPCYIQVQLEAPAKLNGESLVDILFLLGFGRHEIDELAAVTANKSL